ncbi:MAG TPA: type II toxin-antitoxin system VapC family toxin [Coleofasciculaceae cyanobacterium]|jgi:PIN domain nuclease of toxin-antitoxin system
MHLLLDTHTLIWWLANNSTLSITAKGAIANPDNLVFVSAASAWEIAIKKSLGKLQAPDDLQKQIEETKFRPLAINIDHALAIEHLPYYHQDPFDRILIAQAIYEQLTIVTRDRIFKSYDVAIIQS